MHGSYHASLRQFKSFITIYEIAAICFMKLFRKINMSKKFDALVIYRYLYYNTNGN